MFYFEHADHALAWTTEILRGKRFAKNSPFYREVVSEYQIANTNNTEDKNINLPKEGDEKYSLAIKIDSIWQKLPEHMRQVLKFYYWGDYANEALHKRAERDVLVMRSKGIRTRMHYRYSFRQLGRVLGMDHKTAAKRVREAQDVMQDKLLEKGLIYDQAVAIKPVVSASL